MDRLFYTSHSPIDIIFIKNSKNFTVEEVPLYEFSGKGEHLVLKVRKKDLTTWDMIRKISEVVGCKIRDIGYAGLKDKDALTIQYISMPKKYENVVKRLEIPNVKILESYYHDNKIKIGHLKGNNFFIRFKKVSSLNSNKLKNVLEKIENSGLPNYFGYQRFGKDGDNYLLGKEILTEKRKIRDKKKRDFFVSAFQSHLFNLWLSKRVEISKLFETFKENELNLLLEYSKSLIKEIKSQTNYFKLLPGDILHHYPYGKIFECLDLKAESLRFARKEIVPTGLILGKKTKKANNEAGLIEKEFFYEYENFEHNMTGSRRFAWVFPEILKIQYKKEDAWFEFSFFLPKGSYATVLIEELLHKRVDI